MQGITLKHTWIWGHASAGGDSGAYFINALTPTKAAGILSAGNSTTTLYSIIDWVEFETGYRPCYTAGCF